MDNHLISHALSDVWCSPRQDNQWVLEPKRISPKGGVLSFVPLMGINFKLPDSKRYYHVFQVGQLDPQFLNLIRQMPNWATNKWFKFSDAMNKQNLEVTIYNESGVNLPRTDSYYMFTNDRCLYFIIPYIARFPVKLDSEQIYFRFYSNFYYGTTTNNNRFMEVGRFNPATTNDVLNVERKLTQLRERPGSVRCYVNGVLYENFNLGNIQFGDYLEYVYDGSVKKTIRFKMSDLYNFRSELDNVYKYLLHYQGTNDMVIDFQDNLDIHIVVERPNNFSRGLYYNRNYEKNHRMVTHKDYAVDAALCTTLRDKISTMLGLASIPVNQTFIEVTVRDGGENRKVNFENNRLKELYRLPEENIYAALIGVNATVPEWYCVNLEKSAYVEAMSRNWIEYDLTLVEDAYGYNAISKILADTPRKLDGTKINLGPVQQLGCTIYNFDENGLLIDTVYSGGALFYTPTNPNTKLVEIVAGQGGRTTGSAYGETDIPIPTSWDYRVYRCDVVDGLPDNNWVDITGSDLYEVVDGLVKYVGPRSSQWLCVRSDDKFISYDFVQKADSGLLNFVVEEVIPISGGSDLLPCRIPYAHLDIWMNGYKLLRGLDYFVKWPQIYVTNKRFLINGDATLNQNFHIRACRLTDTMDALDTVDDYGWVYHGSLSNNSIYDIREDRVMQITVGGMIKHKDQVRFAENRPGSSLIHPFNGMPYQIKDLVTPFRNFTDRSAYELRPNSQAIDARVSDYLTEHYGDMEPTGTSSIGPRYPVVSPFLSHVLHLLSTKAFMLPEDRKVQDYEVREKLLAHIWLLDYDPLGDNNRPDIRYAYVIPHGSREVIILDFMEYYFFTRVVEIFGTPELVHNEYVAIRKY